MYQVVVNTTEPVCTCVCVCVCAHVYACFARLCWLSLMSVRHTHPHVPLLICTRSASLRVRPTRPGERGKPWQQVTGLGSFNGENQSKSMVQVPKPSKQTTGIFQYFTCSNISHTQSQLFPLCDLSGLLCNGASCSGG